MISKLLTTVVVLLSGLPLNLNAYQGAIMAEEIAKMKLESPEFNHNEPIPSKYTCEGEDVSPPINLADVPIHVNSFAMIVDDPDAPMGTFVHWVTWNIDPDITSLTEGADVPMQGRNDFGELRYRGPCPPAGNLHRYFFKLYALDTLLNLPEGSSKEQLEAAMEGHIVGKGELIGTFQR